MRRADPKTRTMYQILLGLLAGGLLWFVLPGCSGIPQGTPRGNCSTSPRAGDFRTYCEGDMPIWGINVKAWITWDAEGRCITRRLHWSPRIGLHMGNVPPHARGIDTDCMDRWESVWTREGGEAPGLRDEVQQAFFSVVDIEYLSSRVMWTAETDSIWRAGQ